MDKNFDLKRFYQFLFSFKIPVFTFYYTGNKLLLLCKPPASVLIFLPAHQFSLHFIKSIFCYNDFLT
jgi:hypothetical protein